jgi:hypothetical protein
VLVVQGWNSRLIRVLPSGKSVVLAGTGRAGFSGDGGPAVSATINPGNASLSGVVRTADGSVVFTDTWNNRLRRIRPDGVIETIAGTGRSITPFESCAASSGDGGPATRATLCMPQDVLATADGGFVVSDGGNRIRRVARDGTITTIAGTGTYRQCPAADEGKPATEVPLYGLTGLADTANGDILFSSLGQVQRVTSGGRWHSFLEFLPEPFGESSASSPMMDFAGRRVSHPPTGLSVTREGGLLIAAQNAYYVAPRNTRRTLVAVRGARTRDREVTVDVDATRAARATLHVRRRGPTIARARRAIGAGRNRLRVTGSFAARPHDVRVTLRGRNGATARDALPLYVGQTLTDAYARRLAEWLVDEEPLRDCRRFGTRRVDCVYGGDSRCQPVTSLQLRPTGVIWTRGYRCEDVKHAFRRHPEWDGRAWPLGAPDV